MLSKITRNPATTITAVFAILPILTLYVGDLRDAATPLGVPPETFLILGALLAMGAIFGQVWQKVRETGHPVSWRSPSIIGYVLGFGATLTTYVADLADASAPLHLSPALWLVVGNVLILFTSLHRVWQAVSPVLGVEPDPA